METIKMQDEKWLRSIGVNPVTPPRDEDPHAGCVARWLEEREKREIAEGSIHANSQAYEALTEARDREIRRAQFSRNTWVVIAAFGWILAGILFAALVRRG